MLSDASLFDEAEADAIVKAVMLMHNKEVIIINKQEAAMHVVLYKGDDGQVKRAHNFEDITRGDIEDKITELEHELNIWREALANFDLMTADAEANTDQAPVEAETPAPADNAETSEPANETPAEPAPVENLTNIPTPDSTDTPAAPAEPAAEQAPVAEAAPITVQ
jgi:hypothetical protein